MSGLTKQRSVHSSASGRIVTENPALLQLLRERTGDNSTIKPRDGGTRCVLTNSSRLDNHSYLSNNPASTNTPTRQSPAVEESTVSKPDNSSRVNSDRIETNDKRTLVELYSDRSTGQKSVCDGVGLDLSKVKRDTEIKVVPGLDLKKEKENSSASLLSRVESSLLHEDYSQELVTPARIRSSVIVADSLTDKRLHDVAAHDPPNIINFPPASVQTHRVVGGVEGANTSHAVEVSGGGYSVRSDTKTNLFNYISPHSPGVDKQPPGRRSEVVGDSLEKSQQLQDSLEVGESQKFRDSLDFDSEKGSPITGRKTYPVESPVSNTAPDINSASQTKQKQKDITQSQSRPISELSRGIPTPKPSSGVPESAKTRGPNITAQSEEKTARQSSSSVYAVANPAVLAAQGDTPRDSSQITKFTPRAEQAVQRRENTQGSTKPQSLSGRENTQGSTKPQSLSGRENTQGSARLQSVQGRENTHRSLKGVESGRNSTKPLEQDRSESVNNNAKVKSAASEQKSRRSVVSFHQESDNNGDSEEEDNRPKSNHLRERVPTPHPRSPLKPDQATPRQDKSPRIQEWDSEGQSDSETPKPPVQVPQSRESTPSPVTQEQKGVEATNSSLPTVKRVYVDSPTFTKEEEDQYRFVESRLEDGQEDLEDTFRQLDRDERKRQETMATTYATQGPPQQVPGQSGYNYSDNRYGRQDGGPVNNQYSRPPQDNYTRKDSDDPRAPPGGQYIRKDSDQYGRNNNQGQRPQGYDSQYDQRDQNRGYPRDVRGGGDNSGDPRGPYGKVDQPPPARGPVQDDRYEDRNKVMNNYDRGQGQYGRYEDRNNPPRYDDRNVQPRNDDQNRYERYEDHNQFNGYDGNRGQYDDRRETQQYRDDKQPGHYDNRYNDRNTFDDRQNHDRYNNRNEPGRYDNRNNGDYSHPQSLIQNGFEDRQDEDEEQLMKQEEEYQAHLQRKLRTQAQQDQEIVIPKLPLEDQLDDPWQNPPPPPPPPQQLHQQQPYGYDEEETARFDILNPAPLKYDYVENNKVDFGKVPDKSYAYLLERRKESEVKLETAFITPKVPPKNKSRQGATSHRGHPDSFQDDYIPNENASAAETLWAKRSAALEKRKDPTKGQPVKSKTASGTSLQKKRGLQKYPSENGLIRQPLYNQGPSQGKPTGYLYGTPTRNHYLEPLENRPPQPRPRPNEPVDDLRPTSFKRPLDLKPVTQEIVTEDGQRISVDINLKVLSPRGEGADPRAVPQVSAEVLPGSQATGGPRPVGTQYYPGYDVQDPAQDQYRNQYYQVSLYLLI